MEDDFSPAFPDCLAPEVRDYASSRFALAEDLRELVAVQRVEAWGAAVFYAARILEVLTAEALVVVGLPAELNSFHNLDLLQQYNLIPAGTRYWAHALRRLGNEVRHVDRRITRDDAELAAAFLERVLDWFFCRFAYGKRLPALTRNHQPLGLSGDSALQAFLAALDRPDADLIALAEQCVGDRCSGFLKTPSVPALLAEQLLARGENELARRVIAPARRIFADDLRLGQLAGLSLSRDGHFAKALECLKPLHRRWADDDETTGILAGVYKRWWMTRRDENESLAHAYRLYHLAWERSKKANMYLGVNAAATALWLGNGVESRRIAEDVCERLLGRRERFSRFCSDRDLALNFWDHVTLAEAQLLAGQWSRSRRTYAEAFANHADQPKNIAVSRAQALETLAACGISRSAAAFFEERLEFDVQDEPVAFFPDDEHPGEFLMYVPRPIETSHVVLPSSLTEVTERLAESVHDRWAQRRLTHGWTWGPARDELAKKHPGLVPYGELSEAEKEYDRTTAMETLKAAIALGYRIEGPG